MRHRFGHQRWWPGDSSFEVCVGAILTQSTSWRNVELALQNLKDRSCLNLEALKNLGEQDLVSLIRPAGYARVKAQRLMAFIRFVVEDCAGQLERAFQGDFRIVRERLLSIKGIGPETADCMMLYAGFRASFVVDAYTQRIFARHHWMDEKASYADLKALCESQLDETDDGSRLDLWQDFHAQLVHVGKRFCRPKDPRCEACPLSVLLPQKVQE